MSCGSLPLATRGIAHSTQTEISVDIPPGYLTSGILSRPTFHLLRMSHIRNSSPPTFHPGISHPEFFSADIPPGYLTSEILSQPTFHLIRMSHIRNSSLPTFHPDVSHPEFFSADIPPGYLTSGILSRPMFHLLRISHIRNSVRPTFHFFPPSLEHFLEVPKISFLINFAAIFFSACNFNNFHDFKMF